ncbi:MAG: M36 family metallopeptidase [Acidobacteriia bacterium]|nr:M36 family metallopeptidase [Terriglobia bacterium]
MSRRRIILVSFALTAAICPVWGQAPGDQRAGQTAKRRALPDFDVRDAARSEGPARAIVEQRRAAIDSFLSASRVARPGTRIVSNRYGLPKMLFQEGRPLSAPSNRAPEQIAKDFLRANSAIFPFTPLEIDDLRLTVEDASAGAVFLVFNQTVNGIEVYNGQIKVTLDSFGGVVHVAAADVVPQLRVTTIPRLGVEDAVRAAFHTIGAAAPQTLSVDVSPNGKAGFRNPQGDRFSPITVELSIFPVTAASARLAYRVFLEVDQSSWYEILIDAETGELLFRHNLYVSAAQGRVWIKSPADSARQLVTFPDGWMPAGGSVTTGNNVDAYLDANGDDKPDATSNTNMQSGRAYSQVQMFDFPFGDGLAGQDPRTFQAAAVTNLFYFVNTAYDYFYGLGFNEASGSMQNNNFGRGGLGNDAVLAEAQQGNEIDNAEFAPTPDGTSPRMRIGIFTRNTSSKTDDLDADFDGTVVIHEYGHGVSNRLVGGRTSTTCLTGIQSKAMGEGWSDYFSISFFNDPVTGAYVAQNSKIGVRRQSYEGYTYTYEDIGNQGYEVHNDGEIWAATLWDLRKTLGQTITDRLVINGLKATPCNPSMTDARDAILAADQAVNKGANRAKIWQVFARHGLGYSSAGTDGSNYSGTIYNAAYDQPPDLQTATNPAITSHPLSVLPGLGDLYSYRVTATNPAGGTLAYTLTQGPARMTTDAATGLTQWTATFTGKRVKITVTDDRGGRVVHGFFVPVHTTIRTGTPVTIDGAQGDVGYADVVVSAGAPVFQLTLRGGTGDADVVLGDPFGYVAGLSARDGNNETISVPTPAAGHWQILIPGVRAFSGVALAALLVTPTLLAGNASLGGLSAVKGSESFYRVVVPPGATSFSVSTSGGSGDVALLVRKGQPAACPEFYGQPYCFFDFASAHTGNSESVQVSSPGAGDWYIDLYAFDDYSGVTLTTRMAAPSNLNLSPSTLAFTAAETGPAPPAQTIQLSGGGTSTYDWQAQTTTTLGGNWLQISKTSGTGDTTLTVTASPAGLKTGNYQGTVTVTAPSLPGSPQNIPVTLTVTAKPVLAVAPAKLALQTVAGQDPPPQKLAISNAGGSTLAWTVSATSAGGNWLRVSPAAGTGNATVQVSASTQSLAPGSYSGTVTVAASGAGNSPALVAVSLTVAPGISSGGIAGAGGSFPAVTAISPGALVDIHGAHFAPAGTARQVQPEDLVDGNLPSNLAGVCVQVGDRRGFITYVDPGRVTFQVPAVPTQNYADIRVIANCDAASEQRSAAAQAWVQDASPEFLFWVRNTDGNNPVKAVNAVTGDSIGPADLTGSLSLSPAKPGDVLVIYGVSFGPTDPVFAPGQLVSGPGATVTPPAVNLGGVDLDPSDILYAGVCAGTFACYQLNIRVPANLPDGNLPLALSFGIYKTPPGGFIAVKN